MPSFALAPPPPSHFNLLSPPTSTSYPLLNFRHPKVSEGRRHPLVISMARTHERSSSPAPSSPGESESKRLKTSHDTPDADESTMIHFAERTLNAGNIQNLNKSYTTSEPFKHAIVEALFQNDLLIKVKDECLKELSFTEKETDIYKVRDLVYNFDLICRKKINRCIRSAKLAIWLHFPTSRPTSFPAFPPSSLSAMHSTHRLSGHSFVPLPAVVPSRVRNKTCL